jgi:hypothetical protein
MDEVKTNLRTYKQQVLKLLTLVPKCWTIQRTARKLAVSQYMVNKARALEKEQDIPAEPVKNLEKARSEENV